MTDMKKHILYVFALVLALGSCRSDESTFITPDAEQEGENGIKAILIDTKLRSNIDDELLHLGDGNTGGTTRSTLTYSGDKLVFAWQAGDKLTVFSNMPTACNSIQYPLVRGAGTKEGDFTPTDFRLDNNFNYYAFTPTPWPRNVEPGQLSQEEDTVSIQARERIELNYKGQRQEVNENTSHLGGYDFMASYQEMDRSSVFFKFKDLSVAMRIRILPPSGGTYTKFEVMREDGQTIKYKRVLDLTMGGTAEPGDAYQPKSVPSDETEGTHGFALDLGDKEGHGITVADGEILVMYIMFPATSELKDKKLIGKLTDKDGGNFYVTMTGFDMVPGKYVQYGKKATRSNELNVNINVNKMWQVGDTKAQTRASQGDPGTDTKLQAPKNIYIYTCKGGKFLSTTTINATDEEMEQTANGWHYKNTVTIDLGGVLTSTDDNVHIYVAASPTDIEQPDPEWTTTTDESTVAAYTYSISGTDAEKQETLMNLYSYDYKIKWNEPTAINATLYHTAAKMDIQWNNNTASALTGVVSVNGLPTTNLSLFNPTACGGSGSWTPTFNLNATTSWMGRAVFYVPQVENQTYSITTGTNSSTSTDYVNNVTFTAPTAEKKTSWFKANITVEP